MQWKYIVGAVGILMVGWYVVFGTAKSLGATMAITPGDFDEQVNVSGTVIAAHDVDLGFAANGRIADVSAIVGQRVSAGTILAETENGDLIAAVSQKQSALLAVRANLASLLSGTRPEELAIAETAVNNAEEALVSTLQNAYTAADDAVHNKTDVFFTNPRTNPKLSFTVANAKLEASVEQDRTKLEPTLAAWALLATNRSTGDVADSAAQAQDFIGQVTTFLADANAALNQGVSDQTTNAATLASYSATLATARAAVNTAATSLTSASSALSAAEKNLTLEQAGATPDAIAAQEAAVAAATADVQNAQAALAKTRVLAPFSGIVTRMDAKAGAIVSPTASLISLQSDGIFQIETYVPEVSIAGVAVGDLATTTLDAYGPAVDFPSTVVAVDPAETVKGGVPTYKVTLAFARADARIRSGMTANVIIRMGTLHGAIVIPAGAVGVKNGTSYVSVVKGGAATDRLVTTGPTPSLGQVQILSGLARGDVILLAPTP